VQERLGHATIAITLDTYSHWIPSMGADAVNAIDGLFAAS
jgi:integrase